MFKKKTSVFVFIVLLLVSNYFLGISKAATPQISHQDLAEKYAPILYFHPDEVFRPQPVDVILHTSRLRENVNNWFDKNILNTVTLSDLISYRDADFFIDVWYGTAGESDYKNFSAHRNYYLENLSPEAGGPPISVYARVLEDQDTHYYTIQYWLFYYYNDWFNKHEGDWELVEIILNPEQSPEWVILSQHHGGTRRPWQSVQIEDDTHPSVFVALGSHANYFWGNEIYPNGMDVGNSRVEILDRTGTADKALPQIILLPDNIDITLPQDENWISFLGSWGETAFQSDFGGPTGPSAKGQQWDDPYQWGLLQPLDTEVWYQNRFRIITENTSSGTITPAETNTFPSEDVDSGENFFILHDDPPEGELLQFTIRAQFQTSSTLQFFWPDPANNEVTKYSFSDLNLRNTHTIRIQKPVLEPPQIISQSGAASQLDIIESTPQTWNQPDLVWFAGYLTTNQVLAGILISLTVGILPTLGYIYLVYSFDKNEKEPKRLVAAALLWGAFPAILVAFAVNIFFKIPPSLIGPQAVEAIKIGIFSPLVEELLKGLIVFFIAYRYKKEFNNTLDGIIYGAMVGLGFAMTGNTISYLGSFLYRGFESLRLSILVEGLVFGLNHAFYTAIFGAGLGYTKQISNKFGRVGIPAAAFLVAVLANGVHSFYTQTIVGLTPLTILLNWLGISTIFVVMGISIRHENQVLKEFLAEELNPLTYQIFTNKSMLRATLNNVKIYYGIKVWQYVKHLFSQSAHFAFLKNQFQVNPDEELGQEIEKLRTQIRKADDMLLHTLETLQEIDGYEN